MKKNHGRKIAYERIRYDSGQHHRILAVMALLGIVAFLPAALQLYRLMVTDHDYYAEQARRNQSRSTTVAAARGTIYDCNMNILACSVSTENVYLAPRQLQQAGEDIGAISEALGQILELDSQWIRKRAEDLSLRYQQIAANITTETAATIRAYLLDAQVAGVHLEPSTQRYYPYGALASQVIGFTNASNVGSEGIEAAYNAFLAGKAGKVITTKGNNEMDMPYSYEQFVGTIPGCDVILT